MRYIEPLQAKQGLKDVAGRAQPKRFASHNKPIRNRRLSSLLTPK
jgi:hypothetical protein